MQTFLEEVDQHRQLVRQEVTISVVEEVHKLMIHDVVDHHFIQKRKTNQLFVGREEIP